MRKTYYVDSRIGCDQNPGLTPEQPWRTLQKVSDTTFQPGDAILLRADQTFCGQLSPKGSGTEARPITVGRYGEGAKPVIDAGGTHGTAAGNYLDGAAVVLYNQDYWEISDLDITNHNPFYKQAFTYFTPDGQRNVMNRSPENRYRYGVLVRWDNYGIGRHIHLKGLDIHDINGEMQRFAAEGILVVCTGYVGADLSVAPTRGVTPTRFDDVLIQDCTVRHIDRTGISVWSQWAEGRGIDYPGDLSQTGNFYHTTVGPWTGSTGLVVRGCTVEDTAGDGILINSTIGALIERNYVAHTCREMRIGANAAVWPHNADGTVMQYNEVCYTHGVMDGQAFDVDLGCHDSTLQYNYSHDNEGGFLLIMGNTSNNVIRYNISQNDHSGLIWIHDTDGVYLYNNTFYLGIEKTTPFRSPYHCHDWSFTNNIFYFRTPSEIVWDDSAAYQSNCYVNVNLPDDLSPLTCDPGFVDPEASRVHTRPEDYVLTADSPLLQAGTVVENNGGLDYFGKAVTRPFVGALRD